MTSRDQSTRIAHLNDAFRTTLIGGQVMLTAGVQTLGELALMQVLKAVQDFSDFTQDNDPYGEHDFGLFKIKGQRFFWKIDYYDPALTYGSEDPASTPETRRVLTIMLAEDY